MAEKKTKKATKKKPLTAKTADRHILYQRSVQEPSAELDFIDRVYKLLYERKAESLREDFCGTALLCAAWVKSRKERTATGVDIDPKVLAWGKEHNVAPLSDEERQRRERHRRAGRYAGRCGVGSRRTEADRTRQPDHCPR